MWVIFMALCFSGGGAVIYHLNDSEYLRMPPLFRLDDYESCLRDPAGLYCVAKLDLYAEPGNQLMHIIQEYSAVVVRHYNHSYIERGLCVSATCSQYVGALNSTAGLSGALAACVDAELHQYGVRATLSRLYYCDSPRDNHVGPVDELDWAVAAGFAFLVGTCLLATVYDYWVNHKAPKDIGNKYILCFSIKRNWQCLVGLNKNPKIKPLRGFHGARTITSLLVLLNHVFTLISVGFTANPHDFEKMYDNFYVMLLICGVPIIQAFFCMSAFLLVYNFLLRAETTEISWKTVPYVLFLRWWRFIPAYAAIVAFTATWLRFLGSGPLWNLYVTDAAMADCRKYWWYHMLFINNYVPDDKFCVIQTWYLGADMQLFFIGLLVYSTTKHTTRKVVLALLLVLSVVLPALHVWIQDLDGIVILSPEFYRTMESESLRYMHVLGHNNMSALVVGMISANLAYNWQRKGVDISRNKVFQTLSWLVIPVMTMIFCSGFIFYEEGERTSLLLRVLYGSLHRLLLAVVVAVGFMGIALRCDTKLLHLCEWRGWMIPSRLTYCVYLVHFSIIYILDGSRKELSSVSYRYLLLSYLGVTAISYALALPFYLVIEAPMNRFMKTILQEASGTKEINGEVKKSQDKGSFPRDEAMRDTKRPLYSSQGTLSRRRRASERSY